MTRPQRALGSGTRAMLVRNADPVAVPQTGDSPLSAFIRRWWVLLLIGSLLGLGAGYAYSKLGPTSYQSTALLQVRADPSSTRPATDAQIAAIGFATQATAPSVLDHVSQALKQGGFIIGLSDLLTMTQSNKLTAQPIKGSSAITIQASSENAATAQAIADTVAGVAVDDAAGQAQAEADNRTRTVQESIDRARAELQSAQLFQREQDLQQRLQTQQAELIQLQNSFTQTLQQQVQIELLMRQQSAPVAQAPVATADQQRQLSTLSTTAIQALADETAMLNTQQGSTSQTIADIDTQLASVRAQLSTLPDLTAVGDQSATQPSQSVDVVARITNLQQQQNQLRDQQGQELLLEKQEHDLQVQANDLHQQLRALQAQIQQTNLTQQTQDRQSQQQQQQLQDLIQSELNRQGLLKATIDAIVPLKGQTDLTNAQQVQLQSANSQLADSRQKLNSLNAQIQQLGQTGSGSATTTAATVQLLQKQLQDAQAASTAADAQFKDAQTHRATLQQALGLNPAGAIQSLGDQIQQLQQRQHDQDTSDKLVQSQWLTLKQQETDLVRQKQAAQSDLLAVQRGLQADIQRQADLGQRDIQTQVAQSGQQASLASVPAPLPVSLINDAADQRQGLLKQISDQEQQLSITMADLRSQLDEVHRAEAALPTKLDPTQAAVQATVAAQQLGQLSQEYTRLLVLQANGVGPLVRFGSATPAQAAGGQMRMLPLGAAGGLALAAGLAYLLQLLLHVRSRRAIPAAGDDGASSAGQLRWPRASRQGVAHLSNGAHSTASSAEAANRIRASSA